jgi:hypothetical protein
MICEACPFPPTRGVPQPTSNPPEALADVRRADARSAEIDRPAGVTRCFQVSAYKVEPAEAVFACNLLTKHDVRSALADEVVESWPEMPLVIKPSAFACRAERLAGAGSCPDGAIICPACAAQGVRPDANSCEEMALGEIGKFVWGDIVYAPFIYDTISDVPLLDQFAQPCCGFGLVFVVICGQWQVSLVEIFRDQLNICKTMVPRWIQFANRTMAQPVAIPRTGGSSRSIQSFIIRLELFQKGAGHFDLFAPSRPLSVSNLVLVMAFEKARAITCNLA